MLNNLKPRGHRGVFADVHLSGEIHLKVLSICNIEGQW